MSWKEAFIKSKWKAITAAVGFFLIGGFMSNEPYAIYWACFVAAMYLMAVYATKNKWRGFV